MADGLGLVDPRRDYAEGLSDHLHAFHDDSVSSQSLEPDCIHPPGGGAELEAIVVLRRMLAVAHTWCRGALVRMIRMEMVDTDPGLERHRSQAADVVSNRS